ncbi:PRAME family member 12-like [Thomomys bottae]
MESRSLESTAWRGCDSELCYLHLNRTFISMDTRNAPKLLWLAARTLLMPNTLDMRTLQQLPVELFPVLFLMAFYYDSWENLTILTLTWPFTRLPLGTLMRTPHLKTMQAVLEGMYQLPSYRIRPRRWKLKVLDLGTRPQNFWQVWAGFTDDGYLPETRQICQRPHNVRQRKKVLLQVLVDLCFEDSIPDVERPSIYRWVNGRNGWRKVGSTRIHVSNFSPILLRGILEETDLKVTQNLKVHCTENEATIDTIFDFVGKMKNLQELCLVNLGDPGRLKDRERVVFNLCRKIKKLKFLQHLSIDDVFFLKDNLGLICRSLDSSLETLILSNCELTETDWNHLDLSLCTRKLKELRMHHIDLSTLSFAPLRALLYRVSDTLTTLVLEECEITDSHMNEILPILSYCQQLTEISFYGNTFSTSVLKDLLSQTADMSHLSLELYPAPQESYYADGTLRLNATTQLFPQLKSHLRAIRQPKIALLELGNESKDSHETTGVTIHSAAPFEWKEERRDGYSSSIDGFQGDRLAWEIVGPLGNCGAFGDLQESEI